MIIKKLQVKGFRNFKDVTIEFQKSNLIIGANDVGKTNLLYALRVLFDKSLNMNDIELTDSDFNVYCKANKIEIIATLTEITEDVLLSFFRENVKDGTTIIKYQKEKNSEYQFLCGFSEETLTPLQGRNYLKWLSLEYVNSSRDLKRFFSHEKDKMLEHSKSGLDSNSQQEDSIVINGLQTQLTELNDKIGSLNFIKSALNQVNENLEKLSVQNVDQHVSFVATTNNIDELLSNLELNYSTDNLPLKLSGDGRNNQIYLASWISKQKSEISSEHITIYAIEEPEAHLHPHQQRKLSAFLGNQFSTQVFITSHSPTIVASSDPKSLIRLYSENKISLASYSNNNKQLQQALSKINYRLSPLLAEVFFSDGVFLVEGPSEVLFYKRCSKDIGLDLDRQNISILPVNGVGFEPYIAICEALNIPWVMRTDNDIIKLKAQNNYYYSGIKRILNLIETFSFTSPETEKAKEIYNLNFSKTSSDRKKIDPGILTTFENLGFYLSIEGLEEDIYSSPLKTILEHFYNTQNTEDTLKEMKERKAENMFTFVNEEKSDFSLMASTPLLKPLQALLKKVDQRTHPAHDSIQ
jgi:putative ATP-dependent endonuclease of OLD family